MEKLLDGIQNKIIKELNLMFEIMDNVKLVSEDFDTSKIKIKYNF